MSDIERIKKMLADGRLTEEEAAQLITILEEGTSDPAAAAAADSGAERAAERAPWPAVGSDGGAHHGAEERPAYDGPDSAAKEARDAGTVAAAGGWVKLETLAATVRVTVDESLTEPKVATSGLPPFVVERVAYGYLVRSSEPHPRRGLGRLFQLNDGRVDLVLPAGHGADLDLAAGDVRMSGVPYLRGNVKAGNVEAGRLQGVDFKCHAGNVEAELALTEGSHRIGVSAGNVTIRFAADSDVHVKATSSIGNVRSALPGGAAAPRGTVGAAADAVLGSGAAGLEVRVATGDINLEVSRG